MAAIFSDTAQRAVERLEAVLTAVGEKSDVTIKRFCLIALTSLLALCAVGGIITVKTAAFLSHFTH
jgi:hypothetical protein